MDKQIYIIHENNEFTYINKMPKGSDHYPLWIEI